MALTAAEGLGPLPPAAGPRSRSAALAEARRRAGAVHGAALPGARAGAGIGAEAKARTGARQGSGARPFGPFWVDAELGVLSSF